MLENIKVVLGIQDELQDDVLNILISNISNHLKALLGKEIPNELNFIVEEITIRRFNRLGTEGMKSESVEGHRIDFYDLKDEFTPYQDVIDAHKDDDGITGRGKVLFI
ncbi:phage head-tail connector protein [Halalkalibacterium halodurans]|uniref:phage head-tail connector protein n=1 Tax=Halalkalibacterium halodurans TaxID=86665 RepID=UPI002E1CA0BF|nr:phage head-tail connector protein [Halalkalibacterium halodurans]MED4105511.1 phage head-tail connector protein [Halalkalibacterium halodurans]MED4109283.1 phage head-tail connector protein [Halalkalibacterium halodurans]MED4149703.1 phage head-tail connector protein [Halalkalibacterium halodurans]